MLTRVLLIVILTITKTRTTELSPPFNKGIIGKISKQFLQDFAEEIIDEFEELMTGRSFSGSDSGSGYNFNYWDVRVNSISLSPALSLRNDGSPGGGTGQLVVEGNIGGSTSLSGRWSFNKKSWWYSISTSGAVDMSSTWFMVQSRVVIGTKSDGRVGFNYDPTACRASVVDLDVEVTDSSYSWIINILIWAFQDDFKEHLVEVACGFTNEVLGEAAEKFSRAMFDKEFSMPFKTGGEVKMDFNPSVLTGGSDCAIIATPASIELTALLKTPPIVTPDFINLPVTNQPPPQGRGRRQAEDWCSLVPGTNRGISIVLTEDFIEGLIQNLHHFNLLKFELVERERDGNTMRFDVTRNGQSMNVIEFEFPGDSAERLADFNDKRIRISSTEPPKVQIDEHGISASVDLRARVTFSSEFPNLEIRKEFNARSHWRGTVRLMKKDGRYSLIPHITGSVDVWTGKLYVGAARDGEVRASQRKLEEGDEILDTIERLLNSLLEENLAEMLEEEARSGIPLNIPFEYLTIGSADVSYKDGYILVEADDISIDLEQE
ncbi:hypothetical protein ACHWQZ_G001689 [Mnemiopsis leidyi]